MKNKSDDTLIGEGYEGNVYLTKYNNIPSIKKIKKIDKDEIYPDLKFPLWRELSFDNFAKKYPDFFMILKNFSINYDCRFIKKIPKHISKNKNMIAEWRKSQQYPYCATLIYQPVLEGTLDKLSKQILAKYIHTYSKSTCMFTENYYKTTLSLLFQKLYILYILSSNGWIHRDAHPGNWLYKKISTNVVIDKYKLPTKYKLYLCDYGLITKEEYPKGMNDDPMTGTKDLYHADIVFNMWDTIYNPNQFNNKIIIPFNFNKMKKKLQKINTNKTIKFNSTNEHFTDLVIYIFLCLLNNPDDFHKIRYNDKNYANNNEIIKYSSFEISLYTTLINNINKPKKLLNYLYDVINNL